MHSNIYSTICARVADGLVGSESKHFAVQIRQKYGVDLIKTRRVFDKNVNKNTKLPKIVLKIG